MGPPAPPALALVLVLAFMLALLAAACASSTVDPLATQPPPAATISSIKPGAILPGTLIVVRGASISASASHTLTLEGSLTRAAGGSQAITTSLPLRPITVQRGEVQMTPQLFQQFGGEGVFQGEARLRSSNEWGQTDGGKVSVSLQFISHLVPSLSALGDGLVYLNSEVPLDGTGFLLGGAEGTTRARLQGCFLESGKTGSCSGEGLQVDIEVPVEPQTETDRLHGTFIFVPKICGIKPGELKGTLSLSNHHAGGKVEAGNTKSVAFQIDKSRIYRFDQKKVSLGQYLDVRGAGFVGGAGGGSSSIGFAGTFTPQGGSAGSTVSFDIVPAFETGGWVRYVLEEKVGLGSMVDLRTQRGRLSGAWSPTIYWGKQSLQGDTIVMSIDVAPVKQVVWIRFGKSWSESLRDFGLQAGDALVRERIMAVLRRDYQGINVEFQDLEPTDFKLYAKVDISGLDPNGLGLLGYDNTPGKDVGNKRLYDWLGGVNAMTQQDGYPGYGGVFLQSILGFSEHPPSGVTRSPLHTPLFDQIFDPFRPDGGSALSSAEAIQLAASATTSSCSGQSRLDRAACAIGVLGSLVGSTASHELGHSLGLADPYGSATAFHNPGDKPNRLMEAGRDRPFDERAELNGKGPAVFCQEEYQYLKKILPLEQPNDPAVSRPGCY